ncbi:MAG: RDD family protein [Pseudomonadota bacterium]
MAEQNPYATPDADVAVDDITGDELAGRFTRFLAAIVDSIILGILFAPIMFFVGYFERVASGQNILLEALGWTFGGIFLWIAVNGYTLAKQGQTLGKMLLGVRIVSAENGRIIPLWKVAGVRYLPFMLISQVPLLGFFAMLANWLFIFRADRRCIHDLVAGTRVVKA